MQSLPWKTIGLLCLLAIPCLWLFRIQQIWTGLPSTPFAPLDSKTFQDLIFWLGEQRVVIPTALMQTSLMFMSLLGVGLLIIFGLLLKKTLPASAIWSWALSILALSLLFPYAAPGTSPDPLLKMTYLLGLLFVITRPVNGVNLIFGMMLGLAISYLIQTYALVFFWSGFSILITEAFHFLFVEWGQLSWAKKNQRFSLLFRAFSLATLAGILFFCIFKYPPALDSFSGSSRLWLIFISSGLGLALSFIKPWETRLWMRLVSIPFALFFSAEAESLTIMIILWMVIRLFSALLQTSTLKKIPYAKLERVLISVFVLSSGAILFFHLQRFHHLRSFEPEWTQAAQLLDEEKKPGKIIIVGDAIDFLSFFTKSELVQNLPIHLESSEAELLRIVSEENAKGILIDREYLRRFWIQSIKSGGDPSRINQSVFSRLILYNGQAFESKTLNIPQVSKFKIKATSLSKIVWIEQK